MAFISGLASVVFLIPQIIPLALKKHLVDEPSGSRKVHAHPVPNLGGVAIFSGFLLSSASCIPLQLLPEAGTLLSSGLILFMTGIKDDLIGLSPRVKFMSQLTASGIVAVVADLRIKTFYGFGNFVELDYSGSIIITVIFITGLINAYNLIDGIDGLAASLGLLFTIVYSVLFFEAGELEWVMLALCFAGSLTGFLFFNVTPAKIFMGDSGSMLLGFMAAVFSLKFLGLCAAGAVDVFYIKPASACTIAVSIVIVPVFDTIRVFLLRILKGKSPFYADRSHLHHVLLSIGFTHISAGLILIGLNAVCTLVAILLHGLGDDVLICLLFLILLGFSGFIHVCCHKSNKKHSPFFKAQPATCEDCAQVLSDR